MNRDPATAAAWRIRQGTQEHHQVWVSEGCQMFDFLQEFFSNVIVWHHFRLLVMGYGMLR